MANSTASHLHQIYTGFAQLARTGIIDLKLKYSDRHHEPALGPFRCMAIIEDEIRLAYDVGDVQHVDNALLCNVHTYFKRSCPCPQQAAPTLTDTKVRPLGLNYEVYPDHIDLRGALHEWRCRRGVRRFKGLLRPLKLVPRFVPRQATFEPSLSDKTDPLIVFLTRVWDPDDISDPTGQNSIDRHELNEKRVACISALRSHFGEKAIAGLMQSNYANRVYPQFQIPDSHFTSKFNFQKLIRRASVCVTTTGLHRSVGWKMGEYVALGKAIVSEPMTCLLPGDFNAGCNFLSFDSPDQCVTEAERLLTHQDTMRAMMHANRAYYQNYLRPDILVLNTLKSSGIVLPGLSSSA